MGWSWAAACGVQERGHNVVAFHPQLIRGRIPLPPPNPQCQSTERIKLSHSTDLLHQKLTWRYFSLGLVHYEACGYLAGRVTKPVVGPLTPVPQQNWYSRV